jgi:hypothetical protein
VQIIFALIFTYLVFVTPTWAWTRLLVLIDVGLAFLYELTPLRVHFGPVETAALGITLAVWAINLIVAGRRRSTAP